ncbi:hypothetical protein SAMN05216228_10634 [Rhizobium tibeticum]|uniref:Uncharacterized protein n=1 Tax=Rhizobium tibeticum TaxID=501024 RepID=A0A1H8WF73_9HYPH|nr:hypothetical protein RTCCBAU85039_6498 [Rhizobium tibeticum]SEP26163.1 hypothetical protein SAMN05216228_10634 [Rhizobium tibeticum]
MKSVGLERIEKDAMVPLVLRLAVPTIVKLCVCAAYQLLNAFFVRRLGANHLCRTAAPVAAEP